MAALPHPTLARIHALTGAIPLAAFVALHVGETAAARRGRRAFVDGLFGGAEPSALALGLEVLLVIVPLLLHAGIGIAIAARDRDTAEAGPYASRGQRRFQRATGVIVLLFLVAHLSHGWILRFSGASATAIYEALRASVGTPFHLAVYAIGLTAVAMHLAMGLSASARTFGVARTDAAVRGVRAASWAIGVVVWLVSLNTAAHFAVGRSFFGASAPVVESPSEEASP